MHVSAGWPSRQEEGRCRVLEGQQWAGVLGLVEGLALYLTPEENGRVGGKSLLWES